MPKAEPEEQENEPVVDTSRCDAIGRQVLRVLGSPKDLLKVRVHPVGADRFRVNVVTGPDPSSARIINSYFLTVDDKGKILNSSPEIRKMY